MKTLKADSKYREYDVVNQLSRKSDITFAGKRILVNTSINAKADIGIKSKGKIDFLTNYCGYTVQRQ